MATELKPLDQAQLRTVFQRSLWKATHNPADLTPLDISVIKQNAPDKVDWALGRYRYARAKEDMARRRRNQPVKIISKALPVVKMRG